MKRIRYSKYVPDAAGEMSMEDLLSALSDYLLQSGFQSDMWYEMPEGEQTLDDLRRAIEQALMEGDQFDEDMRERLEQMAADGELDELIEKLIERMQQEDYISIDQPPDPSRPSGAGGQLGENQPQAKFEITDKSLDFLGFKSLRNLLGSLRQIQLRTPRHPRPRHRHRSQRRFPHLRVRRHAQPRHHRYAVERDPARRPRAAAQHRVPRPASPPVRVSIFLRHSPDARLLALDDSLR